MGTTIRVHSFIPSSPKGQGMVQPCWRLEDREQHKPQQGSLVTHLPRPHTVSALWTPMGLYRDYMGVILAVYMANGRENGNYYLGFRDNVDP